MASITLIDLIKSASTVVSQGNNAANGQNNQRGKTVMVIDVSGSTNSKFSPSMTVLEKESSILSQYVLEKDSDDYVLYSFDSNSKYHGPISVLRSEGFVNLPDLIAGSATYTHKPLQEVVDKLGLFKPNKVVLFTDGQTHSQSYELSPITNKFKENKINFEVIAVSDSLTDMTTITKSEETRIPGMDLINMLGNSINSLKIYNKFHADTPYSGAQSSAIDKNALMFMGVPISGIIPQFIDKLMTSVYDNKAAMDWGVNQMVLKKLISEIGKLMSVIFINFPVDHIFTLNICKRLTDIVDISNDRALTILNYGFDCAKQNKPIIYTNFDAHVKDAAVKHNEFADAISLLNIKGTTLGSSRRVCLPTFGTCVIDNNTIDINSMFDSYPKSKDKFGNIYFGTDNSNAQAVRIAMRTLCGTLGYRNARASPNVIFHVLNQMSLMNIKGCEVNSPHILELRKLAIMQTSMEVMTANKTYDGVGCYTKWKSGLLFPMHYTNPATHTSLYTDTMINPLKLSEPLWWALMMSMLGIFKEQLHNYKEAVRVVCPGADNEEVKEADFLAYIRKEYDSKVQGNLVCQKYDELKSSIITLENFEPNSTVYVVKNHGECKAETWYSQVELDSYVKQHGCVWCKFIPTPEYIDTITLSDNNVKLNNAVKDGKALTVDGANVASMVAASAISSSEKNVRINLVGITGSGKSTVAQIMHDTVVANGKHALIVSADNYSKKGVNGRDVAGRVYQDIAKFNALKGDKVIIVDVCNENGVQPKCFNYDLSSYTSYNYTPNFDPTNSTYKFNDYECWCLNNVLNRPMHNANTNYWLNPVSAGVKTCIKVHNMKANGIKGTLKVAAGTSKFNENMTMDQIKAVIKDGVERYKKVLETKNLDVDVVQFLTDKQICQ
jgi:hypothetical protein